MRTSGTTFIGLVCLLLTAFSFPAFASEDSPSSFVTLFGGSEPELDPQLAIFSTEAQMYTALHEGLFSYDPSSLDPVNAVCQRYLRSQDGKTYTFTLRSNARWSDGQPVLARDFRDSWIHAMNPATDAAYATFFDIIEGAKAWRSGAVPDSSGVGIRVVSDRVLEVRLAHPAPWFTRLLCHHSFAPIHPSLLGVDDWTKVIPYPVNGPWMVESYTPERMELVANPFYRDASTISIPRLTFIFTDDDTEATRMFNNGEAHWLAGPMDLDEVLDEGSILINPLFSTTYWYFSCSTKPWDDARIRRALALLLPWDSIRSEDIYTEPATTLVLQLAGYSEAEGIEKQDRNQALALLTEAGYPEGAGLPPIVILATPGKESTRITDLMKKTWQSLPGVQVSIRVLSYNEYHRSSRSSVLSGNATLATSSWIGDFADPLAFLQLFVSDSGLNDAGYHDAEYDKTIAESSLLEGRERLKLLATAETRLLHDAAVLPVNHGLSFNIIDVDYIEGWYTNPLDIHPYRYFAFGERQIGPNVAHTGKNAQGSEIAAAPKVSVTAQGR